MFFHDFSSVVRQMPGYNSQRRGTAHTLPKSIVFFYALFVCKCVLYYCHRVSTQLRIKIYLSICLSIKFLLNWCTRLSAAPQQQIAIIDVRRSITGRTQAEDNTWAFEDSILILYRKKGKAVPLQARCGPEVSRRFRLPDFHDFQHMKVVRSSASRTGHIYPQEIFLVLICTRSYVDPRAMVRSEGNMLLKNPVTTPRVNPGTVQLVAQRLNHYATPGPSSMLYCFYIKCNLIF